MDENVLGNVVGSLINRNRDDFSGCNGIWIILLLFMFSGGMWGTNRFANPATTQDVAASNMFTQIDNGIRAVQKGIADNGYATLDQFGRTNLTIQGTGNNLAQAIAESTFAAKDCCCQTQRNLDGVKYELSKGIDNNRYELTRNVDALRYDTAQQTCAITTNATANTQKILDKLCQMESNAKDNEIARLRSDLQATQLTLAQSVQTQNIVSTLKPPPVPAYVVGNPYCNCGNIAGGTTIV